MEVSPAEINAKVDSMLAICGKYLQLVQEQETLPLEACSESELSPILQNIFFWFILQTLNIAFLVVEGEREGEKGDCGCRF